MQADYILCWIHVNDHRPCWCSAEIKILRILVCLHREVGCPPRHSIRSHLMATMWDIKEFPCWENGGRHIAVVKKPGKQRVLKSYLPRRWVSCWLGVCYTFILKCLLDILRRVLLCWTTFQKVYGMPPRLSCSLRQDWAMSSLQRSQNWGMQERVLSKMRAGGRFEFRSTGELHLTALYQVDCDY